MPVNIADQKLFVKSYFASSVDEGMAQARADLGPDALLLNTREAPPEARHLGEFEVVFGVTSDVRAPAPAAGTGPVDDLRQRMDELRNLVTRMASPTRTRQGNLGLLEDSLVEAGLDRELAQEIGEAVWERACARTPVQIGRRHAIDPDPDVLLAEALAEINGRFAVAPALGRITALVGPPGSGKTTTLIKLAVTHGLAVGRPVHLISTDHYRIAAVEQLRTYAAILGVSFHSCETTVALTHAIDAAPPNALVLIDTPGYSRAALEESSGELARYLSERQDIDTHLVLTASMRPSDLHRAADAFATFGPSKLLFTRLDESEAYGSMFCEAARRNLPLSFVCSGQLIPEDLAPASKEMITASLAQELPKLLRAVA